MQSIRFQWSIIQRDTLMLILLLKCLDSLQLFRLPLYGSKGDSKFRQCIIKVLWHWFQSDCPNLQDSSNQRHTS